MESSLGLDHQDVNGVYNIRAMPLQTEEWNLRNDIKFVHVQSQRVSGGFEGVRIPMTLEKVAVSMLLNAIYTTREILMYLLKYCVLRCALVSHVFADKFTRHCHTTLLNAYEKVTPLT